jgi:uroporphyrin-III C-methyltransferase
VNNQGKVFLIGAGPGDPNLLTLRAAQTLGESDVIVYDYLVNPEVLRHARRGAELIYAGKRHGETSITQAEINRILIEQARQGRTVSRVKGGDPFMFGRGGEEAEALAEAGVQWEVVPGVSSGLAAAAYAGIPLTHRDYSSSVAFVTGHRRSGLPNYTTDWSALASAADTIVIFMCGKTITEIVANLIANGRAGSTPIAIIRRATYEDQEVYSGTLEDLMEISDLSDEEVNGLEIPSPAIAIVGEVVTLKDKLDWFGQTCSKLPLEALAPRGRTIR